MSKPRKDRLELNVPRFIQPDEVSCGPTCLMQIYRYYGDEIPLEEIRARTRRNPDGGTMGVYLGLSALKQGYRARIYPFTLRVFDPTWFDLPAALLQKKLARRGRRVKRRRLKEVTRAYREFLEKGGEIAFEDLSRQMLKKILRRGHPILTGLSATYLYRRIRERPDDNKDDDVGGEPTGHFTVICGFTQDGGRFTLRDPSVHAPFSRNGRYSVPTRRLLNAILLGDVTYDAVLVELWPGRRRVNNDRRKKGT